MNNRFNSSVVSYPKRGPWGDYKWRGNCSGHIIQQSIDTYLHDKQKGLFVDPSKGSDTSGDVARELGVRYKGFDLHEGFNLLKDDLLNKAKEPIDLVFWHPPYGSMIQYSGNVWGTPHTDDLSRCENIADFVEKSQFAMMNIFDALKANNKSHYCVLIGNMRKNGRYYDLAGMLQKVAPGRLEDIIIKTQHNCVSDKVSYAKPIVRITHETMLVFKKDGPIMCAISYAAAMESRANRSKSITWKNAIKTIMRKLGTASLNEIYREVEPFAKNRTQNNFWKEKGRQVLQTNKDSFKRVDRGVYALA
ncbi:hypothetical protein A3715_18520 [Oleiphilus sp. HI0009]|nr:hypothetical protein A3715_18520 [Oleiphilus sp. HI0009]